MINENNILIELEKLKEENSGVAGLKAPVLIDKIKAMIINESIKTRIEMEDNTYKITDVLDNIRNLMCDNYCKHIHECNENYPCPLDLI